jgi:hypothetical protein
MDTETLDLLAALAAHLHHRRQAILDDWRAISLGDSGLETASKISVLHFEDIAPVILDSFEQKLRTVDDETKQHEKQKSFEHGAHRWQEGYSLREMVREWGHFQSCVMEEIERYGNSLGGLRPDVLHFARRLWLRTCSEGISSSVDEFDRLQPRPKASSGTSSMRSRSSRAWTAREPPSGTKPPTTCGATWAW